MLDNKARFDAATRLIRAVTGEEYGDGETVTDIGVGYAEPGYHDDETVWVLGDWNDKPRYVDGNREVTDNRPSRLFDALERIGVQGEWLDEWTQCSDCYRAVRTQGDSYGWRPFYTVWESEITCGDCLIGLGDDGLHEYVNDSDRAVTWCDAGHLESLGWTRYNPAQYENGLHAGMNDSPAAVLAEINEAMPEVDVLFYLDESSQFYVGFSAFTRPRSEDDD